MSNFKDLLNDSDLEFLKKLRDKLPTSKGCYRWVHQPRITS